MLKLAPEDITTPSYDIIKCSIVQTLLETFVENVFPKVFETFLMAPVLNGAVANL